MQKDYSHLKLFECHPQKKEIFYLIEKDKDLKKLFVENYNFKKFKRPKGFEGLVRLITEQQLSVASAKAIFLRIKKNLKIFNPDQFLNLSDENLKSTGLSRQKINYCRILARSIKTKELNLTKIHKMNDENLLKNLTNIKGIGEWTAECYMLASLDRPDIWPVKDLGLQVAIQRVKNLKTRPSEEKMIEISEVWRPYRSIVANVLWASYD